MKSQTQALEQASIQQYCKTLRLDGWASFVLDATNGSALPPLELDFVASTPPVSLAFKIPGI